MSKIKNNASEKLSLRQFQTPSYGLPKEKQLQVMQDISKAHVDSFNFALKEGIPKIIQHLQPLEMELSEDKRLKIEIKDIKIGLPCIKQGTIARTFKIYPAECRIRNISYQAKIQLSVAWSINGKVQEVIDKVVGEIPIMVKSNACNLSSLKPKQLIEHGEEENEFGGYFIINGIEKVVRMLIMQRRNYPIAMTRSGWKKRGDMFTDYGVLIRCVRPDQTGTNMVLHYLSDGSVKLMFIFRKEQFFAPAMLILKALCDETDYYIYKHLIHGKEKDLFYQGCVKNMLRMLNSDNIYTQEQALSYIGNKFRVKLNLPPWYSDTDAAKFLLKQSICVSFEDDKEKFDLLVIMIKKLFAVVKNECALESPDNPMNHEILLPGHFYLIVLKEKLQTWLGSLRLILDRKLKLKSPLITKTVMNSCISLSMDITRPMAHVFATGNFISRYDSSLMQSAGLSIVAEKLNFWRYLSHFRSVHRGAFFAQLRTTTVRKLLPEAWGFLCPVHTPDGAPCGLLNHMSAMCEVTNLQPDVSHLPGQLCKYGMIPHVDPLFSYGEYSYCVMLDGKVIGWVLSSMAENFVRKLRCLKSNGEDQIPHTMEIGFVRVSEQASQFPGIFMFTSPGRMMRPVKSLLTNKIELIGSMEQVYLHIAIKSCNRHEGLTTHEEIKPTGILSIIANMIPYSDFNQSPRNMYECQMGKQTMGTPCHSFRYRADNKMYHLLSPQSPIVRPKLHDQFHMDDYPVGTNAIVAVIAYTGFDMEDAIIINKSSLDRGFKHGTVYKSEIISLKNLSTNQNLIFGRKSGDNDVAKFIDADGLPYPGTRVNFGDPICGYMDPTTGEVKCEQYKSTEEAYIHEVKILGNDSGTDTLQEINIKLRVPRNPIVGDKFASRHGQKGICSMMLPVEDMPFTESGMTPDIIFNPHGFPSRMTIGMMIESMAGKSGAIEGELHDATPFFYSEQNTAIRHFGDCLTKAGYDYFGTERMYSGVDGRELEAHIFFGVVYYQRLRHMVADKFQVRTTGPVDKLTHQPVKGRKRNGGIRFGEMERDSLLSHGSAFLLHDRLFNCSDKTLVYACTKCESVMTPLFENGPQEHEDLPASQEMRREWVCGICGTNQNIALIDLPYVFRYLCAELAAINLRVQLKIT